MVADPGRVPNVKVASQNGFTLDMFGRLKISDNETLFDSQNRYKDQGDFSSETSGTGSATHLPNESSVALAVGTASGDKITQESKRVFAYQPGKSIQILQTFCMAPAKAGLRQRVGYFSRQNGVYLEQDGTSVYLVKRTYVSGSVAETRVAQADWNIERMLGDGKTDIVLDLSKVQILFFEIEWLGAGSIRAGFVINGVPIVVHRFDHANVISTVYMTTASLPLRYEIENTSSTASASTMRRICATVISNGGYTRRTEDWTASRSTTVNVSSNLFPLVSLRMASDRTDAIIVPSQIGILPIAQGNYEYALVRNATLTGASWTNHTPSGGNVDYDISATAMTGGTSVAQGFVSSSNQASSVVRLGDTLNRWDLQLGRTNADTPVSDTLTLAIRSLGGTQSAIGSISWNDLI